MKRCLHCGAELHGEQCGSCGLTAVAAALVLRHRLLNRTAVFLLGGVAFLPASNWYPPLELDAMLIFVGVVFFLTLGLAVWLERRTRRQADVRVATRVYYGLVLVPWLLAALLLINGRFDTAPPTTEVALVVEKFTMPGTLRSSRLVVTSWRAGRQFERVPVGRDDYDRFRRGDRVEVRVQEGLVGIPWVYAVYRR